MWRLPWVLFVLLSAASFALLPMVAILEGCGLVAEVALMRFGQIATATLLMWGVLWQGGALLALVAVKATEVAWTGGILLRRRALFRDLLATPQQHGRIEWRDEIWPLQWRTALTWISSILITPLFNPLLFAFRGPAEAGRMGLSISIIAAINTVGLAWVNARGPTFGMLIARGKFDDLDSLFFPALFKSSTVVVVGCVVVFLGALYLQGAGHPWSTRILPPATLLVLLITAIVLHLIYAEAVYLRAHKAEPFVVVAVLASLATGVSSYFLAQSHGAAGVAAGYLVWMTMYLTAGTYIFQRKRREWHSGPVRQLSEVAH